jgi:hypothetical protein
MSRDSKRTTRLASLEARMVKLASEFLDLSSEAQDALHALFRTQAQTHGPVVVTQMMAALLERCGLGVNYTEFPDGAVPQDRFRQFFAEQPNDVRTAAVFQASCILLRDMSEILLQISQECAPAETEVALVNLMRRIRPKTAKSSGMYRIRKSKLPPGFAAQDAADELKARFSTLPPATQTQTLEELLEEYRKAAG